MYAYQGIVIHNPNEKAQREGAKSSVVFASSWFMAETDHAARGILGTLASKALIDGKVEAGECTFAVRSFG